MRLLSFKRIFTYNIIMPKIIRTLFFCLECDTIYKNNNSLGNHNRKYHPKDNKEELLACVSENTPNLLVGLSECSSKLIVDNKESLLEINKSLTCESCNKVFKHRSSKSKHKKICKEKISQEKESQEKESPKIINNNTNTNSHNTTNNNNNITNNNNFNITYNFNSEENKDEYLKTTLLNDRKKIELLLYTDPINYILRIVEIFNCGDNKNFANVLINNLKSKYVSVSQDGEFISEYKDTVLNKVIDNSYWALSAIRDNIKYRFQNNGSGDGNEINLTKTAFEKITEKYIDFSDNYYDTRNDKKEYIEKENPTVKYKNFDTLNKERISMLLYNNRLKIKNKHDNTEN